MLFHLGLPKLFNNTTARLSNISLELYDSQSTNLHLLHLLYYYNIRNYLVAYLNYFQSDNTKFSPRHLVYTANIEQYEKSNSINCDFN